MIPWSLIIREKYLTTSSTICTAEKREGGKVRKPYYIV
jgi:hypothetical protein